MLSFLPSEYQSQEPTVKIKVKTYFQREKVLSYYQFSPSLMLLRLH